MYFLHKQGNKPSSEKNKVPGHCRNVAGSATKQFEMVLSFKVSLFIQSWKQRAFVYLGRKKSAHEDLSFSSH